MNKTDVIKIFSRVTTLLKFFSFRNLPRKIKIAFIILLLSILVPFILKIYRNLSTEYCDVSCRNLSNQALVISINSNLKFKSEEKLNITLNDTFTIFIYVDSIISRTFLPLNVVLTNYQRTNLSSFQYIFSPIDAFISKNRYINPQLFQNNQNIYNGRSTYQISHIFSKSGIIYDNGKFRPIDVNDINNNIDTIKHEVNNILNN